MLRLWSFQITITLTKGALLFFLQSEGKIAGMTRDWTNDGSGSIFCGSGWVGSDFYGLGLNFENFP